MVTGSARLILLSILLAASLFLWAATAGFALLQGRSARRQSTHLKRMLEATSDLFAVLGADGTYKSTNAGALTGYSQEELRRMPLGGLVHPEDAAGAKDVVRQVMAGAVYQRWEGRLVHKNGRTLWVDTALFFDPDAHVMHLISRDVTERKRAELDLQDRERRLRSLVEHHPDAVVVLDRDGAIVDISPGAADATGHSADDLRGQSYRILIHPADLAPAADVLAQIGTGVPSELEMGVLHTAGHRIDTQITVIPIVVADQVEGFYAIVKDITEKKRAQAALRESEARYRTLTEAASDAIITTAADGRILFANAAAGALFGYSAAELTGAALGALLPGPGAPAELEDGVQLAGTQMVEVLGRHRSGRGIPLEVTCSASTLHGQPIVICYARDISERKAAEARLSHLAYHDQLTGLPNRAHLLARLTELHGRPAGTWAVLYLNLDRFKRINDSLGNRVSDNLMLAVAQRLAGSVPAGATLTHLGGDEFAILLPVAGLAAATAAAEQVISTMKAPFVLRDRELTVTTSIGIVLVDAPHEVMKSARLALRSAKRTGKNRYAVFDPGMRDLDLERLELEADLRQAVARQEFTLVYQPVVRLETNEALGMEALVRWQRPGHGLVPPGSFIAVAEETGLILPLGRWILAESCRQTRQWQRQFGRPLQVSVNLSARQLVEPGLAAQVAAILAETGLDPRTLILEITESILVPQDPLVLQTLADLRAQGIRVAMDDFGTGYSALSYLKRLPVDILKLDRSFVAGLGAGQTDNAIVEAVLSFAAAVNLTTVGEGVETEEQREMLRQLGCRYGQGYLFARPLPPDELVRYLGAQRRR